MHGVGGDGAAKQSYVHMSNRETRKNVRLIHRAREQIFYLKTRGEYARMWAARGASRLSPRRPGRRSIQTAGCRRQRRRDVGRVREGTLDMRSGTQEKKRTGLAGGETTVSLLEAVRGKKKKRKPLQRESIGGEGENRKQQRGTNNIKKKIATKVETKTNSYPLN